MKTFFGLVLILVTAFPLGAQPKSEMAVTGAFFSSFDGTKIYYEVIGKGKPIILIHGFVVDGESWKRTALYDSLRRTGYKVITMDLRGNGKSDKPHTPEAYLNDAEAKDIMGIVSKLKIKNYSAIGYSRGSIIAARLLVLDKRVNRAVLGGMGADFTNPDWPRRIMFYEGLMGKSVPELEGLVKYIQEAGLDQQAMAYMQNGQPSTSIKELAKLTQSVLVISGTEDVDNGSAKELADLIPHSTLEIVSDDHGGAVRTPEFAQAVITFMMK